MSERSDLGRVADAINRVSFTLLVVLAIAFMVGMKWVHAYESRRCACPPATGSGPR